MIIISIAIQLKTIMTKIIANIKKTRSFLLDGIKDLSDGQLNKIPAGFNNNIIWNLGHMIAAQQGICYRRSGATPVISNDFWERYRTGSKPAGAAEATEIENIKTLFLSTIDQLESDINTPVFDNYTAWTTRYGVEITSISDAVSFVPFHEGLHLGTIMSLKRLL
jgi:DinB superfamily